MAGKGVRELVKRAMNHATIGPGTSRAFGGRPWAVHVEWVGSERILSLRHYSTKMLEWTADGQVLGWWAGWGSVSDQQGVNAALSEIGSPMRYHRDARGGGPRVNPYRVSSSVRSIVSHTPPVY